MDKQDISRADFVEINKINKPGIDIVNLAEVNKVGNSNIGIIIEDP